MLTDLPDSSAPGPTARGMHSRPSAFEPGGFSAACAGQPSARARSGNRIAVAAVAYSRASVPSHSRRAALIVVLRARQAPRHDRCRRDKGTAFRPSGGRSTPPPNALPYAAALRRRCQFAYGVRRARPDSGIICSTVSALCLRMAREASTLSQRPSPSGLQRQAQHRDVPIPWTPSGCRAWAASSKRRARSRAPFRHHREPAPLPPARQHGRSRCV